MRRAIGANWPAMTRMFGILPFDVERLTYQELRWYWDAMKSVSQQAQKRRG